MVYVATVTQISVRDRSLSDTWLMMREGEGYNHGSDYLSVLDRLQQLHGSSASILFDRQWTQPLRDRMDTWTARHVY